MSGHKLEALLDKCEQVAIESGAHQSYRACRDAFKELREALAGHEAEQRAVEEAYKKQIDSERAARQAAQIELEHYKSLLARARLDLIRELIKQGWVQPSVQDLAAGAHYPQVSAFDNSTDPKCRQRLQAENKPYPRPSCEVCGTLAPNWKECDAKL